MKTQDHKKHMKRASFTAALLASLVLVGTARADQVYVVVREPNPYARRHFYLGIEAVGVAVIHQTGPHGFLEGGGGFNFFLGGRLSRWVALEAGWQPTFHSNESNIFTRRIGTIGLDALTLDVKIFPIHGAIQPYFAVGAGAYFLGDNFDAFAEGPGYQIGGGIDFWVARFASIGLKAQYRGVELFDYDLQKDNTYLSLFTGSANFTGRF
jgi:hypothetical protein